MLDVFKGVPIDTVGSSERLLAIPWVLQSQQWRQMTQRCFTWSNEVISSLLPLL